MYPIRSRSCTACAKDIPAGLAFMFNPLGAGFRWRSRSPPPGRATACSCSAPGQRGLASVIARARRRRHDHRTGLSRDARKLALARELAPIT